jgi:hypothetical protein
MNTTIMRSPMELLSRAYGELARRSRGELQVSPVGTELRFSVAVLGVMGSQRLLMVAAPRTRDNSLIAVTKGKSLTCQWLSTTTIWRFTAVIANLAFEPAPIVYLGQVSTVHHRTLRGVPRALAALPAALRLPGVHAALVTDISTSGARVGVAGDPGLQVGQSLTLALRLRMLGRDFVLDLPCTVTAKLGQVDPDHPLVSFFGLQFGALESQDELALHAYVQERLVQEADLLSQLLASEAAAG